MVPSYLRERSHPSSSPRFALYRKVGKGGVARSKRRMPGEPRVQPEELVELEKTTSCASFVEGIAAAAAKLAADDPDCLCTKIRLTYDLAGCS